MSAADIAAAATSTTTGLLRPGLLEDVVLLVAGNSASFPGDSLGAAVTESCKALGATVECCQTEVVEESALDDLVTAIVSRPRAIDMLVVDGASLFATGDGDGDADADGHLALRACLDATWNVTRAVINHAFLPAEQGGRIVYLAPAPGAGEFAETARAGLENLSRTLSTEWARHDVKVVAVAPGEDTPASEVAALCAYLASPAGAYFSGCMLDLRGV